MKNVTESCRSLLAAAKADAPSAATKAKVWNAVQGTVAASASIGVTAGGGSAAKTLMFGALLGGTITVGLASALVCLRLGPFAPHAGPVAVARTPLCPDEGSTRPSLSRATAALVSGSRAEGPIPAMVTAGDSAHGEDMLATGPAARPLGAAPGVSPGAARTGAMAKGPSMVAAAARVPPEVRDAPGQGEDDLAREAALLARARAALARGNAAAASSFVHAAASIPGRQLVPEELAIEAQALRALGRSEEADALGAGLRALYPESALGR